MAARQLQSKSNLQSSDADYGDSFKSYIEYNKTLRTWFVAYGIGGPALFLVNDKVADRLLKAGSLKLVVLFFLMGIFLQVTGALLNKIINWYVYESTLDPSLLSTRRHRCANWLIDQFWIDVLIDIFTIASFGMAAWHIFTVFIS
jgi:hypothetical protein